MYNFLNTHEMNKVFYYEFLYQSDMALARTTADLLKSKLGIPVYPSLGMFSGSNLTHSGIYFEAEIKDQEDETNIENIVKSCITGIISTLGEKPTAAEYNAYPLTIFNKDIEDVAKVWYELNDQVKKHPEGGFAFSSVIYEKNGNVEVSGTFQFKSSNEIRSFLANDLKKTFVRKLSKAFPDSKLHF